MPRGTLGFEVASDGSLVDCAKNVELLRKTWLDRSMLDADELGEGDPGDFDHGAWHIACHLVAAGGVRQDKDGHLLWIEASHDTTGGDYRATVTTDRGTGLCTYPLASGEGRMLLRNSTLLGFVEGNSLGRTAARGANDPPTHFNLWRRQQFDQPIDSAEDGGRVWEHWCTTRDIRPSCRIGTSVLTAYISLVAALGDLFPAVVARGRRDYYHPRQLAALVVAGLVDKASAIANMEPVAISPEVEPLLLEARPSLALEAVTQLDWDLPPRYFMYARRIDRWCPADQVREEIERLESLRQ